MPFDPLTSLPHWIQHQPNVETAHKLNGGWERWASADMAITFIMDGMKDVITEDNCYRPYQEIINRKSEKKELRCDIAIRQVNAGVKSWDILELKCWRFVATSLKEFINQIGSDIAKIRGNVLDDTDPFKPYEGSNKLWAIGLMRASDVASALNAQTLNAKQARESLAKLYPTVNVSVKNSATKVVTQETHDLTFEDTVKDFVIAHWHEVQQSD